MLVQFLVSTSFVSSMSLLPPLSRTVLIGMFPAKGTFPFSTWGGRTFHVALLTFEEGIFEIKATPVTPIVPALHVSMLSVHFLHYQHTCQRDNPRSCLSTSYPLARTCSPHFLYRYRLLQTLLGCTSNNPQHCLSHNTLSYFIHILIVYDIPQDLTAHNASSRHVHIVS